MACRIFDCNRLCGLSILRHLCRTHAEQFFCWARASVLLGWFLPFFHIKHLQDGRQRLIDHSSLWPKPFTKANTVHHQSSFHPAPSSCKKKKRKKCWGESQIKKEREEKCLTETVDGIQSTAGAGWDLVEACSYINYPADTWWLNSSDSDSLRMLNWSVCLKVQDNRRNGEEKYRPGTCNSWIKELPDFFWNCRSFFFSLNFSAKLPGEVERFHQVVNDIKELPVASETEIVDIFVMIGQLEWWNGLQPELDTRAEYNHDFDIKMATLVEAANRIWRLLNGQQPETALNRIIFPCDVIVSVSGLRITIPAAIETTWSVWWFGDAFQLMAGQSACRTCSEQLWTKATDDRLFKRYALVGANRWSLICHDDH